MVSRPRATLVARQPIHKTPLTQSEARALGRTTYHPGPFAYECQRTFTPAATHFQEHETPSNREMLRLLPRPVWPNLEEPKVNTASR
ncbi:MAG: hypothetical protein M2R45_04950 [Verrucomicrobia subdivision 3 bacterium]|nr:hypothetical protein [Limisphaerales bacterium]MCS1415613.1 hypothetical protein [Limisphaerales bacterium]